MDQSEQMLKAAKEGNKPLVKSCLSSGTDIEAKNGNEHTAVSLASMNGKEDVVKYLISLNCNVNTKTKDCKSPIQLAAAGGSAVSLASLNGKEDVVKYLISLK